MPVPNVEVIAIGFAAGMIGSVLGIGGGVLMTPLLIALGYDITVAVPASLLAIVGTSVGGLYVYEKEGLVDYRLGTLLLSATVLGSIIGVMIAAQGYKQVMRLVLAVTLVYTGIAMLRKSGGAQSPRGEAGGGPRRLAAGWAASLVAGAVSSLAGVGGGVLVVPIINRIVGAPIKRATATSKMMLGATAATGALGYLLLDYMEPCLGLLLLAGTLTGGLAGSLLGVRVSGKAVTIAFAVLLIVMGLLVIVRG